MVARDANPVNKSHVMTVSLIDPCLLFCLHLHPGGVQNDTESEKSPDCPRGKD